MIESELIKFLQGIDNEINLRKEDGLTHLYYRDKCMGIGIAGELTNGTEYTFETLRTEIAVFFEERIVAKLIIPEVRNEVSRKKGSPSRRNNNKGKSKPRDRF